jgi:hypothetical protein
MSRAQFLKRLLASTVFLSGAAAFAGALDRLRGDRVGWARLKTSSPSWKRHATGDPTLMQFLHENTMLNLDPIWREADVQSLDEMRQFPLLFSQGVHVVQDRGSRANVAEYLRRGGFLLADACCNPDYSPRPDPFLQQHVEFFAAALPEARVVSLPADHPIYRCHFQIPKGRPPHTFVGNVYDAQKARHGLYGVMLDTRMAGVISLSGLQCGWDKMIAPPNHDVACMKMLVNIYIYAMAQGA